MKHSQQAGLRSHYAKGAFHVVQLAPCHAALSDLCIRTDWRASWRWRLQKPPLVTTPSNPSRAPIPIAFVCGLCIALIFVIMGCLMAETQDEFMRLLLVRQTLIASGFALSCAAIHGFMSDFDFVQRIDAYWWPVLFFIGQFAG